ncbi:MAG: YdcF family protein [Terracidiphilus sp.]
MPKPRPTRSKPIRRLSHQRNPHRRRLGWRSRLILAGILLILILLAWGVLARLLAPTSNTSLTRFDAIIVLGTPADRDGNPSPEMLARVTEGVHEYERGVAPRLILSGAAAHNQFTEARVMAAIAHAQGIPESAIFEEPQAMDTIQNACYAERIMKAHGWRSAEVVSSVSHLPRAGIIFSELPLEWRTHAAPPLEPESAPEHTAYPWAVSSVETLKTVRYLIWTRWRERCQP